MKGAPLYPVLITDTCKYWFSTGYKKPKWEIVDSGFVFKNKPPTPLVIEKWYIRDFKKKHRAKE